MPREESPESARLANILGGPVGPGANDREWREALNALAGALAAIRPADAVLVRARLGS